ncbi:MAG: hypothetical protein KDK53_02675 [Maritimibacter sp.]|nr:hypothetical protein [Maritimibacter sp.]
MSQGDTAIKPLRRILKATAAAIAAVSALCAVWAAVFFTGFFYASAKYQQISRDDTRAVIEEKTGFLRVRPADASALGGYRFMQTFRLALSVPGREIVTYGLFGAFFTVIYDPDGNCLAMIDNGLDG